MHTHRLALLTAVSASMLTSCLPAPQPTPDLDPGAQAAGINADEPRELGFPLPDGSEIEPTGATTPSDPDADQLTGTLRPRQQNLDEAIPTIRQRGRLIVGIDQSINRLSFRDPVSGELSGFEVALAHEIAADIFGNPDAVEFRFIPSSDRTAALERREVDLIAQTLSITPERQREIQFSAPYLSSSTRVLVQRDSGITSFDDLAGRRVCAVGSSTPLETARRVAPASDILKVATWSDCLMAVQQRQADAIIADDAILLGISDQDPFTVIPDAVTGGESYGLGIRHNIPGDDASGLVRQVNSTLERIGRDGTWDRLYDDWFADSPVNDRMPEPVYTDEADQAAEEQHR